VSEVQYGKNPEGPDKTPGKYDGFVKDLREHPGEWGHIDVSNLTKGGVSHTATTLRKRNKDMEFRVQYEGKDKKLLFGRLPEETGVKPVEE